MFSWRTCLGKIVFTQVVASLFILSSDEASVSSAHCWTVNLMSGIS